MYRVLKPDGVALILDMNHAAKKEDIENEVRKSGMEGFDRWFVMLSFKTFLKSGAYTKEGSGCALDSQLPMMWRVIKQK